MYFDPLFYISDSGHVLKVFFLINDQFAQDTLKTIMSNFIPVGQAVSGEKMFEKKVKRTDDEGRNVLAIAPMAFRPSK